MLKGKISLWVFLSVLLAEGDHASEITVKSQIFLSAAVFPKICGDKFGGKIKRAI